MKKNIIYLFLLANIANSNAQQGGVSYETIYTVPIVVHVLYNSDDNLWQPTVQEINSIIDSVNLNFRGQGTSSINREVFDTIWADTGIDFCLAKFDEQNNPTTGVVYTDIGYTPMQGDLTTYYSEVTFWDEANFLNLIITHQGNNSTSLGGVTHSPPAFLSSNLSPSSTSHVMINGGFSRNGLVNMITHEFGHYFGLHHLWESLETLGRYAL